MPREDTQFKKGQHYSVATEFKKGMVSTNKGRHYCLSAEARKHISDGHKGEKAYQWKGDDVGYDCLHRWVRKQLGKPTKCVKCNTKSAKRYVWANISGEYKRNLTDWQELCNSCNLCDNIKVAIRFNRNKKRTNMMNQPMNSLQDMGMLPNQDMGTPDGSSWGGKSTDYVVVAGDTVDSICQQFGVKPNELAMINNVAEDGLAAMIQPGQKILVPDMNPTDPNQSVQ